jgi:hypothetical protein
MPAEYQAVLDSKAQHTAELMKLPNVVGVGVGYRTIAGQPTGDLSLKVLVIHKLPRAALTVSAMVPKRVDSVETDVIEVGELRAQQTPRDRWRPAPPGVSLGHYQITTGTFGAVVRDRASGARLMLSNNHVLANSNAASPGDPILQPGTADGGTVQNDLIARLERFCPIVFNTEPGTCSLANTYARLGNWLAKLAGSEHRLEVWITRPQAVNLVDAAVARPLEDDWISADILSIGPISGTAPAALGMPVRKSGRTTGFTTGEIIVLEATVTVSYGPGRAATFENQIITTPMSQGGDSGSLLVHGSENRAVGLLYAGSSQSTIHNPIQAVLDCLEVDL